MVKRYVAITPQGLLGQALWYLDKSWKDLAIYTEDGRVSIGGNLAVQRQCKSEPSFYRLV